MPGRRRSWGWQDKHAQLMNERDQTKMTAIVSAARGGKTIRTEYYCKTCGEHRTSKKHRAHIRIRTDRAPL